jgi:hypothetical protein
MSRTRTRDWMNLTACYSTLHTYIQYVCQGSNLSERGIPMRLLLSKRLISEGEEIEADPEQDR